MCVPLRVCLACKCAAKTKASLRRSVAPTGLGDPSGLLKVIIAYQLGDLLLLGQHLMKIREPAQAVKPFQHNIALQPSGAFGQQRRVGRIRILTKVVHEAMLLWVPVDVIHKPRKVSLRRDLNSPERGLEETARALIGPVDRLGIRVEEIRKASGNRIESIAR